MILLYACIAVLVIFFLAVLGGADEVAGVLIVFILIGAASYAWAVLFLGATPIGP